MYTEQLQAWHKQRHIDVTGAQGDLTLIAMHELTSESETTVKQIAGSWKPTSPSELGLTLTATAEDQLFINGVLVEGEVHIIADETIVQTRNGISAMATSQPGSMHLLAIWDENSPALQTFSHIAAYEMNKQAIYNGKLIKDDAMIEFSHTGDAHHAARSHVSTGVIEVEIGGVHYRLRPFQSGRYSIIIFRDATSGNETYSMGRMLIIEQLDDDTVLLDFNKAFLPPCAFSSSFNCPMPPLSNRIQSKIEAGEKQIISLHS
ncbi:DUF1684 domain-containing protein [Lysinibacillus sp. C5.1]|uniref:DUF1684 domain-containing protein n=1 Tax=Lysinibacillus sp. C5.1 TaxID=2796169 RepID=UPI0030813E8E